MTKGELAVRLLEDYGEESIETMIDAIAEIVTRQRDEYAKSQLIHRGVYDPETDLVAQCIDATIEHLDHASDAWYASWK